MIRTLKIVFAVNLVMAILLVAGYIWYGLSNALPIDQHFLGNGPFGERPVRVYGPVVAPWKYYAVVDSGILVAFIIGRIARKEIGVDRALCLIFGVMGLCRLLFSWLMSNTYTGDEFDNLHVSRLDCLLGVYVFCSHLLYGLFGLNSDRCPSTSPPTSVPSAR